MVAYLSVLTVILPAVAAAGAGMSGGCNGRVLSIHHQQPGQHILTTVLGVGQCHKHQHIVVDAGSGIVHHQEGQNVIHILILARHSHQHPHIAEGVLGGGAGIEGITQEIDNLGSEIEAEGDLGSIMSLRSPLMGSTAVM